MRTQTAGGRKDVIYCLSLSSAGVASARMSQTSRPGQTPKEPPTPPATPPPVEKPRYEKPGAARHRRPPPRERWRSFTTILNQFQHRRPHRRTSFSERCAPRHSEKAGKGVKSESELQRRMR